jgi:hypothetical protein
VTDVPVPVSAQQYLQVMSALVSDLMAEQSMPRRFWPAQTVYPTTPDSRA